MIIERGVRVRSGPFIAAVGFALALSQGAGLASAQGRQADAKQADAPVRLAQRWTPLTGILAPEGEGEAKGDGAKPAEKAAPADKAEPSDASSIKTGSTGIIATTALSLKMTLAAATSDGVAHGGLGVKTIAVDADLADGLKLGNSRGALVTEASQAATGDALRVGDIIERIDGTGVAGPDTLLQTLKGLKADQEVTVDIRRAGNGAADFRRLLIDQAEAGNVGAAASLGRLISLGLVLGNRDFVEAARWYLRAAEAGNLGAMTRYALFAKDGIGMPRDEALAARWFQTAAEGGQDAAMTNLGTLYETGRGVKQDYAEAARWYRRAVDKGHIFAMHRLALLYESGRGIEKDDQEAVRLLETASEKGLSEATAWLADKYEQGRGIPKNQGEAERLHTRAADQVRVAAEAGNAVATFNLGILYRVGKGVKKSDREAAYWVVRSLRLGDKYLVSELMRNPEVLTEADRKWLQQVLRDEGTYHGPIDGSFTPAVRTAMESLANRA
jgi:TPR repeat protein